jgi:hypothetical protein
VELDLPNDLASAFRSNHFHFGNSCLGVGLAGLDAHQPGEPLGAGKTGCSPGALSSATSIEASDQTVGPLFAIDAMV